MKRPGRSGVVATLPNLSVSSAERLIPTSKDFRNSLTASTLPTTGTPTQRRLGTSGPAIAGRSRGDVRENMTDTTTERESNTK